MRAAPLAPLAKAEVAALMAATWPAASERDLGPFRLRDGAGGGKRVSAASCEAAWDEAALTAAEVAMPAPLFVLYHGDEALDAALAARNYAVVDPVVIYAAPVERLSQPLVERRAYCHWPPLQIAKEIWAEADIGPGRLAVMDRAVGPKTAILGRTANRPAAAAFVACHGAWAMLHALEVRPVLRRQGMATDMLRGAALWAAEQGATSLSLAVTEQNLAARAVYDRAGMEVVGKYHYRAGPRG